MNYNHWNTEYGINFVCLIRDNAFHVSMTELKLLNPCYVIK